MEKIAEYEKLGLPATSYTDENNSPELYNRIIAGHYKLVFTNPEMVVNEKGVAQMLMDYSFKQRLSCIVIDDAHLVMDWYISSSLFLFFS